MIDLSKNALSLADFKRNTTKFIKRLVETGHPLVLTVNGKAELVVQDVASYQRILERIDVGQAIEGIQRGLEDVEHGRTQPADEAFERIRAEHDIPRGT